MSAGKGKAFILNGFLCLFFALNSYGATYYIDGRMSSVIELEITEKIECHGDIEYLQYQVAEAISYSSKTFNQKVAEFSVSSNPNPSNLSKNEDIYGNRIFEKKWLGPKGKLSIKTRYRVENEVDLSPLVSVASFPLEQIPEEAKPFLRSTAQVQSDHPDIVKLARKLTKGARGGHEAVTMCLNWVVDNTTYTLQPERYDALYTMQTGRGNCQNFSHLSAALLRAVGIPTKIITGITLKDPWKVSYDKRTWTLNLATGHHAWIEVYLPDLGWVQYDAQQTHHFVSTRYIRLEKGVDTKSASSDGYARWKGKPNASPRLEEVIEAKYLRDQNLVRASSHIPDPRNNLFASLIRLERIPPLALPVPPPLPEVPKRPPIVRPSIEDIMKMSFTLPVEFGNLDFPKEIDIFADAVKDEEGGYKKKNFVVESAEYVTSREIYAQAFKIDTPLKLTDISLALHKFGGTHGDLWIELMEEKDGKIVPTGVRSHPIKIQEIKYFQGYRWVVFQFPKGLVLLPDRYWIVFRYSGDPIVNWFYIFGNPYGDPDDTRSKPMGEEEWTNTMNYDFNFRVRGYHPKL